MNEWRNLRYNMRSVYLKLVILPPNPQHKKIANDLVYSYKDHGFVIDKTEAIRIFGEEIINTNTQEYDLGNFYL